MQVDLANVAPSFGDSGRQIASLKSQVVALELEKEEVTSSLNEKISAMALELRTLRSAAGSQQLEDLSSQTARIAAENFVETIKQQQEEIHRLKLEKMQWRSCGGKSSRNSARCEGEGGEDVEDVEERFDKLSGVVQKEKGRRSVSNAGLKDDGNNVVNLSAYLKVRFALWFGVECLFF